MSPGFTGVGSGPWTIPQPDADAPEVYLIYENARFCRGDGPAPGAITEITEAHDELTHGASFGWSFGDGSNIKVSGQRPGDPSFQIHRSATAGKAWTTPIPTTHATSQARAGDDAYSKGDSSAIFRTVDSGTTWNEIVAAPIGGTYQRFCTSTGYLYIELDPDSPAQANPQIKLTANTGGSPSDLLHDGRIVGQVDEGMLLVDMAFDIPVGEIVGPWHLKRYVGGGATDVTGVPDEYFVLEGPENTIVQMYQSRGVACKGNTAILAAKDKPDHDGPFQGVIYRSTNKGVSFTEVKRWTLDSTTEKFGTIEVGYAGQLGGIWWVGGASDSGQLGLWRSEDDGLTWTFVKSPDVGLAELDNTPQIISSGRPDGMSR